MRHLKGVLLTAAGENQKAREYSEDNGLFERFFAWVLPEKAEGGFFTAVFLQQLKHHPHATLEEVFEKTRVAIKKLTKGSDAPQHPQIMGDTALISRP
ncbi:MAG: hypothetical protein GY862_00465 [Gammaproteobacteria bacterium]|nr:hypothetical protein [Gammaproteobacteria bacterium]